MVVRSQSPDAQEEAASPDVRLVGDLAVPFGMCMYPVKVEGVTLATGLDGTGSDPIPSPQTQLLLGEMQARGVQAPNAVLASPNTALVVVQGVLRPGIQKGDTFDVQIRVPSRSETTSLRGAWLLPVELKEFAVLSDQRIHSGHTWGRAAGPVMVDPAADGEDDRVMKTRGRVLGGAIATKSRPLALELNPERRSVLSSARIETAINKRFHSTYKGIKVAVAKAKTDRCVELTVHPRYKDNIQRYMRVVRAIAIRESEAGRQRRLEMLEQQLLDPITSSRAALQLEAIGAGGVEVLRKGIASEDPEIRFYSAEALAYLDQTEAAEPLAQAARETPAFRVFALTALSAMDDLEAADQLRELLNGSSAETRYGAFRALWAMGRNDPMVMGENLGSQFSYHVLDTDGPPMIHVTRSRRPEVVLFGTDQRLNMPLMMEAGNQIMVVGSKPDEIAVSKFAVGEMDQKRMVTNRVDEVIRAIVELGGTYPDVVQALQEAKHKGVLSSRFEIDALPEAGRTYQRLANDEAETARPDEGKLHLNSPLPDLFTTMRGEDRGLGGVSGAQSANNPGKPQDSDEKPRSRKSFFARMIPGRSG
ncbi:MAG: flagellar basal body P-ring protein FlgI [Planctomycetota bacterium]